MFIQQYIICVSICSSKEGYYSHAFSMASIEDAMTAENTTRKSNLKKKNKKNIMVGFITTYAISAYHH